LLVLLCMQPFRSQKTRLLFIFSSIFGVLGLILGVLSVPGGSVDNPAAQVLAAFLGLGSLVTFLICFTMSFGRKRKNTGSSSSEDDEFYREMEKGFARRGPALAGERPVRLRPPREDTDGPAQETQMARYARVARVVRETKSENAAKRKQAKKEAKGAAASNAGRRHRKITTNDV